MKISIVMAYHNRKIQTIKTLDQFNKLYFEQKSYNFEVVIVDDNSNPNERLDDIIGNYGFPINLILISAEEKGTRVNPCISYNKGFEAATGDIIIIQNPECYHVGDILSVVYQMDEYEYLIFSCYNTSSMNLTQELLLSPSIIDKINDSNFNSRNSRGSLIWYNHPQYNPVGYHFCTAIFKSKLKLLGGFDKRFANGYCFDDNELLLSIKNNLKLNIKMINTEECFVIHQYHEKTDINGVNGINGIQETWQIKWARNKALYDSMELNHTKYNFKYPKLLHLYWDGSPLSYLNYLTVISFNEYHKEWKIIVYMPTNRNLNISWTSNEQKLKYTGTCYLNKLELINNVTIQMIDLNEIGFKNDASEVIKSDYFRYYILHKHGGVWGDFDIMFTGSIEEKMNFDEDSVIFRCTNGYGYYPIGFFIAKPNNILFKYLMAESIKYYDPSNYQCIGAGMWAKLFPNTNLFVERQLGSVKICNHEYYLPWAWNQLEEFLVKKDNILPENNIGIHWFNGAAASKQYAMDLDNKIQNNSSVITCYLDKFVSKYLISSEDHN